ncbi:MAG: lysophospholipase [Acidimicrobiia bacterium]|nr:lysophospholipase [Acidimicrobiia bacterium]
MTTATISYLDTADGLTLLERHWEASSPVAYAVVVHGLGEHSGRYEHLGSRMAREGIDTVAADLRSFGRSGGRTRSYVDRFDQFLDDLEDQLHRARSHGEPVVVLGHSMGGLIAVAYAVSDRPQPDCYVVSAPPLGIEVPRWQRVFSRAATRVTPRLAIPNDIDSVTLSRDPEVQRRYDEDPLVQHDITARLGGEMFAAMADVSARLDQICVPMLVLHGADDVLVNPRFSAALGGVPQVRRELLPGLRHEIFNEPERDEVLDQVVSWLHQHH